jgi:hypothetical protein
VVISGCGVWDKLASHRNTQVKNTKHLKKIPKPSFRRLQYASSSTCKTSISHSTDAWQGSDTCLNQHHMAVQRVSLLNKSEMLWLLLMSSQVVANRKENLSPENNINIESGGCISPRPPSRGLSTQSSSP